MSANLTPQSHPAPLPAAAPPGAAPAQAWPNWGVDGAEQERGGPKLPRYLAALRRYKWLVLGIIIAGTGIGLGATQLVRPEYEARATVWLAADTPQDGQNRMAPIRSGPVVNQSAWDDLLKTGAVLDNAVIRERLYVRPANARDHALFEGFGIQQSLRPGTYSLAVDAAGSRYTLSEDARGTVEEGAVGDSVGRALGFQWMPDWSEIGRNRTLKFTVVHPRAVTGSIISNLSATLPDRTNLLQVSLRGVDPRQTAATLNAVLEEFESTATQLKKRNLVLFTKELEKQLSYAEEQMRAAEGALQGFRTRTITEPGDNLVLPSGTVFSTSPALSQYFQQQVTAENLRVEREALERAITQSRSGDVSPAAFLTIPSVQQAPNLTALLDSLTVREAQLRTLTTIYTDSHPTVRQVRQGIERLRRQEIPGAASGLLAEVRRQEQRVQSRVAAQRTDIQQIPARTIREASLQRDLTSKANLYSMLRDRYEEAKLAEASAMPDVAVLDTAVTPSRPISNSAPSIVLLALLLSVGAGLGVALVLDLSDRRFRYPEQAMHELGLTILGAVPTIKRVDGGKPDAAEAAQVVEAFRTIRLGLTHAYDSTRPVQLTISSPGPGEGKSLIASNLALSFAEAGYRTLLIDGDIRRGELHAMFAVNRRPGLIDYLVGSTSLPSVTRHTAHDNLTLIPCGSRRHRGPELLWSPVMSRLISEMRDRYDAIIVDSPPLAAGVDPFVLGTATGNMLLVLRTGETDRKLAQAKLSDLDRLPVRLLGAVLNDIQPQLSSYRYYSYLYGYSTAEDESAPQLTSRVGEISR